jgi:hypothetical protein
MDRRSEKKLEQLLVDFTENLTGEEYKAVEFSSEEISSLSEKEVSSLFETVQVISSVIQSKEVPEEFLTRVSRATQERFQEQMSVEKIQRIIGMAVTMEDFRRELFQDIVAACRGIGLSLTPKEIAALRNLKEDAVKEFANSLDERITKFFPTNLP